MSRRNYHFKIKYKPGNSYSIVQRFHRIQLCTHSELILHQFVFNLLAALAQNCFHLSFDIAQTSVKALLNNNGEKIAPIVALQDI